MASEYSLHPAFLSEVEANELDDSPFGGFVDDETGEFEWVTPMKEMQLMAMCSPKQIAYAQAYFETGGNHKKAKEIAGYTSSFSLRKMMQENANFRRYMTHVRSKMMKVMGITRASVIAGLADNAANASEAGDFKAVNGAYKEIAEIMGMKIQPDAKGHVDAQGNIIQVFSGAKAPVAEDVIDAEIVPEIDDETRAILAQNGMEV